MPVLMAGEIAFEVDEDGFMREPDLWTEAVARVLATGIGVDQLTEDHWKVIRFIRAHYLEHDLPPMVRVLCRKTGLKLTRIYQLFPSGPSKGACKVAGLPNGTGCV